MISSPGAAIAGERFASTLNASRLEIETHLSLGATPWQTMIKVVLLTASPGIFEIMKILGKEQVLARLKQTIRYLVDKS